MRWFRRTIPLLLCLIATVQAAQNPQQKKALAQVNHAATAASQQKNVSPADIARRYQLQPGIQDQLTLTPASQTTTTGVPVILTANCGTGFSCASFHFVWGDGKKKTRQQLQQAMRIATHRSTRLMSQQ